MLASRTALRRLAQMSAGPCTLTGVNTWQQVYRHVKNWSRALVSFAKVSLLLLVLLTEEPAHLGLATPDGVLELVIELYRPAWGTAN